MLCSLTVPTFASEPSLSGIASNSIIITHTIQENGLEITTYENLDIFINEARSQLPEISDYDIAEFILELSGQNSATLPEIAVMKILEYDNFSIATSYIQVDEAGNGKEISEQEALIRLTGSEYTDPSGVIKFNTGFSKLYTSGTTKHFNVWASATWIDFPNTCVEDAFVLGTNASYNDLDVVDDFGYVHQTFKCLSCGKYTSYYRTVYANAPVDDDLILEYTAMGVPSISFVPYSPYCQYGEHNVTDFDFTVYINYDVLVEGSAMIQAAYGHKTVGLSGINVSISADGTPKFSGGLGVTIKSYYARPVSLT